MRVCKQHPIFEDEISGYTLLINDTSTHREAGFKIAHEELKLRNVDICMIIFVNITRSVACSFLVYKVMTDVVAVCLIGA